MKIPRTDSPPPPDTNMSVDVPADLLRSTPHPVVEAEQRAGAIVAQVLLGVRNEMRAHMEAVKLELRAVVQDNSVMRQNLALLNEALGDFQRLQVIPLRDQLQTLRDEGGATLENNRKLEALIRSLTKTIDVAGGIIPPDLKQQILDGRFENLPHRREGEMVDLATVQDMIEAAYARGRADATHGDSNGPTRHDGALAPTDA